MTTDNKAIVQHALTTLLETRSIDALAPLLSDDFIHHRDTAASTKTEWLAAVDAALTPLAGMEIEVHHLLSDGDHVVMHSRRRLPDGGPAITVADIWRIADGLIAEGWEVIEPTALAAANRAWWEADERSPAQRP
ncbi:nuclear transport factor 2 family protein [Streptomyces sp. A7024]|uniref:Nuclear transport factor 2 family protein n=1 Tax=Streptomyces coryli TaxID=1128680 RepID=A0A6G4TVH1_9ACTN|nr:nuclear transport factor 2 family protein [Streptomyces coryli]NGN63520.1 nuclear transport factor 2 family protein [Streptomyces coryli]